MAAAANTHEDLFAQAIADSKITAMQLEKKQLKN